MERLQHWEFSRKLAQATHISIGEAEQFVAEFFNTIARNTAAEETVDIYGFGQFKRDDFTPCPQLADAVNKPFVNFQPVEITADVEADEVINQKVEEDKVAVEKVEEENVEEEKADEENADEENVKADEENVNVDEENVKEEILSESDEQTQSQPLQEFSDNSEDSEETHKKSALWLAVAIVAVAVVVIAGIFGVNKYQQRQAELLEIARLDSIETCRKDSIRKDSIYLSQLSEEDREMVLAKRMVGEGKPGAEEIPCNYTLETAKKLMPHSAYTIDGTDTVVVVQKNQSLKDIGDEHGLPYGEFIIQLHNGIESVKEGQRIRIPRLKLK